MYVQYILNVPKDRRLAECEHMDDAKMIEASDNEIKAQNFVNEFHWLMRKAEILYPNSSHPIHVPARRVVMDDRGV